MFKLIMMATMFIFLQIDGEAMASGNRSARKGKSGGEICGFIFANVGAVKITKTRISISSLKNRIDNERYNACPYKVTTNYLDLPMKVDFGSDVTLYSIENWEEQISVSTGVFEYGKDGWTGPSGNLKIDKSAMTVKDLPGGVVVSGIFTRQNSAGTAPDYCFGISAVGTERFLTSLECRPTKDVLKPINNLFQNAAVISFQQATVKNAKKSKWSSAGASPTVAIENGTGMVR